MPCKTNQTRTPSGTSKRARIESRRQREGCENEESLQHERADQKAKANARRIRQEEDEDNNLLIEREEEAAELAKLRAQNQRLVATNEQLAAKLDRRKQDPVPAVQKIKIELKGDITVGVICQGLKMEGVEKDAEWHLLRGGVRRAMYSVDFNWDLSWSKQPWEAVTRAIYLASLKFTLQNARASLICVLQCEKRLPELKIFDNHAATEFLLKQSFRNHLSQVRPTGTRTASEAFDEPEAEPEPEPEPQPRPKRPLKRLADVRKAREEALTWQTVAPDVPAHVDEPLNDGETEIDERGNEATRVEHGVADFPANPSKTPAKQVRPRPRPRPRPQPTTRELPANAKPSGGSRRSSHGTPPLTVRLTPSTSPAVISKKPKPVVLSSPVEPGRSAKGKGKAVQAEYSGVVVRRRGHRGSVGQPLTTLVEDDGHVSSSSGQTGSDSDD